MRTWTGDFPSPRSTPIRLARTWRLLSRWGSVEFVETRPPPRCSVEEVSACKSLTSSCVVLADNWPFWVGVCRLPRAFAPLTGQVRWRNGGTCREVRTADDTCGRTRLAGRLRHFPPVSDYLHPAAVSGAGPRQDLRGTAPASDRGPGDVEDVMTAVSSPWQNPQEESDSAHHFPSREAGASMAYGCGVSFRR